MVARLRENCELLHASDTLPSSPLFLGKSLELLAQADVVYFAPGWADARGCRIEHLCAVEYGIDRIEA